MNADLLRLRRPQDFRKVYERGRLLKSPLLVMHWVPNDLKHTRIGFSVSRKLGKAVVRNKVKRRLKELTRFLSGEFPSGYDIVISARVSAKDASFQAIRDGVRGLIGRLNDSVKPKAGNEQ